MSAAMRDDASTFDADVLVVGAGPVGQTLSIDLAKRGVSVLLIERNETCLQHPKMERCNARTMEFYRRLGVTTSYWFGPICMLFGAATQFLPTIALSP
jgi:2-polyprenyl-6-methoxyphenol hydroxylase-like FAD-dependent oxidoreductase